MKKVTVLIYNENTTAEKKELRVATPEEWSAILKANRGLPMCQCRCFIEDTFEDCGVIDRMFIEVLYEKYRAWDAERKKNSRNREAGQDFQLLSLDYTSRNEDGSALSDCVADSFDLELYTTDSVAMDELRVAPQNWKPWAVEMLDFLLANGSRNYAKALGENGKITAMSMSRRKKAFEQFVKDFYGIAH
jgi:hypothetical protein